MSRLIVKNLPKSTTKQELKDHFSTQGQVTDVKLHYTKDGVFRRFGFVGYKTEDEAQKALKYFDKSFINTTKITVNVAKDFGDDGVSRPWSKYSSKSSAFQRLSEGKEQRLLKIKALQGLTDSGTQGDKANVKQNPNKGIKGSLLKELDDTEQDPAFQEFLKIHQSSLAKQTWSDDVIQNQGSRQLPGLDTTGPVKSKASKAKRPSEGATTNTMSVERASEESDNDSHSDESVVSDPEAQPKSDLAWLQSKTTTLEKDNLASDADLDDAASSNSDSDSDESDRASNDDKAGTISVPRLTGSLTVKLRGLPFKSDEKDIIQFLSPIRVLDIRMLVNTAGKPKGVAYVDLSSHADVKEALKKDGSYMGKRYIEVCIAKDIDSGDSVVKKKWEQLASVKEREPIYESGRLFIRNLSYTCTEEEVEELFGQFGPLSEVHLPIDKSTKATIGIGFVTYMMPEHAVLAYNNLDGKVFQGRIMHVLPADAKREVKSSSVDEQSSFKKQKEKKMKATSSSSHNWNTLFLGQNAVADVMADRLKTSKSKVLSSDSGESLAVRMALGETQIVSETRDFLVANGVKLDAFGQANAKRSTTVILVKNLPTDTAKTELRTTFSKYGEVQRLVLPPSCVTALIEFQRPSEAKEAFQSLAYSKFRYVPLYLEWAPTDVFQGKPAVKVKETLSTESHVEEKQEEASVPKTDGNDHGSGTSVLFVKNLNFETSEDVLQKRFSNAGFTTHTTIARKKDAKKPNQILSMGYGFIEFCSAEDANRALIKMQHSEVEGHKLELKRSNKAPTGILAERQKAVEKEATGSKILVRNVPFEANKKEIKELFAAFGELKMLRLPKKVSGTGSHRGFAFVEFLTKQDAKRAFASLCQSTHLYGRRLVLEWAENEDTVDSIRKRTVQHYHKDNKLKKKKQDFIAEIEQAAVFEE